MKKQSKLAAFFGLDRTHAKNTGVLILTLLLLVAIVALNCLVTLLPERITRPNVTGSDTFRISGATRDFLKMLDEDVTLYLLCEGGRRAVNENIYRFLSEYTAASKRVTLEVVDPAATPSFLTEHSISSQVENLSILVKSANRSRLVPYSSLSYYYNSILNATMTDTEYRTYCISLSQNTSTLAQFMASTTEYFDAENYVTNAIHIVSLDRVPTVCVLSTGTASLDTALANQLSQSGYDLRVLRSLSGIPEGCDMLMIYVPTSDLSEVDAAALETYLAGGGKLWLSTSHQKTDLPKLSAVLAKYGLQFGSASTDVVIENHTQYALQDSSGVYPQLFYAHIDSSHAATGSFDGRFVVYYGHEIKMTATEGVILTSWLKTSEAGQLAGVGEDNKLTATGDKGCFTVGAIAEKGETQIIWLSSPDAMSAQVSALAGEKNNFDLVISAMNAATGIAVEPISIAAKPIESATLNVTVPEFLAWGSILALLLPIAALTVGIVICHIRKKQ